MLSLTESKCKKKHTQKLLLSWKIVGQKMEKKNLNDKPNKIDHLLLMSV